MPVLISEIICGCLCLLLGLWTMYITCHINDRYNNRKSEDKITPTAIPSTKYPYYQTNTTVQNLVPEFNINDDQTNKLIDNRHTITRHSYPLVSFNNTDKPLYRNTVTS
jgi:hypothetical protein